MGPATLCDESGALAPVLRDLAEESPGATGRPRHYALSADVTWPIHVSFATAEAAATYVMLAYRARVAGDTPPPKTAEGWASAIEAARASKASGAPLLPSASSSSSSASSSAQ